MSEKTPSSNRHDECVMKKLTSLPRPDEYGNYYFRSEKEESAPAILVCQTEPQVHGRSQYFVTLHCDPYVLTHHGRVALFEDPQQALRALQKKLRVKV